MVDDSVDLRREHQSNADAPTKDRRHLNERLRQAFIDGAEEDSQRRLGRGLTADELERSLQLKLSRQSRRRRSFRRQSV